jgi:trimeric autotransporter adhesin
VFFSKTNTTDLDTSSTVKAAKRAQKAGSAAAANAAKSAQNAAAAAQNAAGLAEAAARNAAIAAASKAHVAASKAQDAGDAVQSAAAVAQAKAQTAATAAANAAQTASTAAQNASDAAQSAATIVSKNVKDKVFTARKWAAPRLESAADYTTGTVAPKVSATLRSTADQVRPVETSSKRSVLTWAMLAAGIVAGLGAAAALVRYRFRAAIAADSETADEEVLADSTGSQAAPVTPDASTPASTSATESATDTSANGRVKSSGSW